MPPPDQYPAFQGNPAPPHARFTFLGTGTSAGVPVIGCGCHVCTSANPKDTRLRTSACIEWVDPVGQHRAVVIDTGPDFRQQVLRCKLQRLDAVLFTHNHVDHTFGLDDIRRFNATQHGPIDIYADDHTMDSLERVYEHIFRRERNVNDSFVATLIQHRISEQSVRDATPIVLWGMRFLPIRFLHGRLPVLGFRIEPTPALRSAWAANRNATANVPTDTLFPLAYCTDLSAVPPETWKRLTHLQTLVLDCLRPRKHPTHLSLDESLTIAHQVAAPATYFIHMTHDVLHDEANAELPEGVEYAYDGLTLAF